MALGSYQVPQCAVPRITTDERRARLARRHHLAPGARTDDVVAIAGDMVAVHATDPATVILSVAARMRRPAVEALERALYYQERSLVRTLCMRRTMFVLPVALVPVVQAACSDALGAPQRRRTLAMLRANGVTDAEKLRELEETTLAAIEPRGEATGAELARTVPRSQPEAGRRPRHEVGGHDRRGDAGSLRIVHRAAHRPG